MLRMSSLVTTGTIRVPLKATDRDGVIAELMDAMIQAGIAPEQSRGELLARVMDRERRGSTGVGRGVGVPHVKHPSIKSLAAGIGVSTRGIDFNSLDRQPVYTVVLLLSPEDRPEEHLQAMEVIFRHLGKETFRRALRQCAGAEDVRRMLEDADGQQLPG